MSTRPTIINLNDTTPAAPDGEAMVHFQGDENTNPRNVSGYIPTADATSKGCVQVVGDIQGTGDLIQVSGIQGLPISNFPDTDGLVPMYDASGAIPDSGVYGSIRWGSVSAGALPVPMAVFINGTAVSYEPYYFFNTKPTLFNGA